MSISLCSVSKANKKTVGSVVITVDLDEDEEVYGQPYQTPTITSAQRNQKERLHPSIMKRSTEDRMGNRSLMSSTSFGSEIIEDESEEIATRYDFMSRSSDDRSSDGRDADVVSVENFSKICQVCP